MPLQIPFVHEQPLEYTRNALTQAGSLLTPAEGDLVSFKIRPLSTWPVEIVEEMANAYVYPAEYRTINEYLSRFTKRREGLVNGPAAVFTVGSNEFVFVEHETGPEIILFLGIATAALGLAKAVVELVTTVVKAVSSSGDEKKPGEHIVAAVAIEERTTERVRTIKVIKLPVADGELDSNDLLKTIFSSEKLHN